MCKNILTATVCVKNEFLPKTKVLNLPANILFGTDMFKFDKRISFTHT